MPYRVSVNSSTGKTPNMMAFGREVVLPLQAVIGKPAGDEEATDPDDYLSKVQTGILKAHDVARANLKEAANYHYEVL